MNGSRVLAAYPHPKMSKVFTPWHGALFQAPLTDLMPLTFFRLQA